MAKACEIRKEESKLRLDAIETVSAANYKYVVVQKYSEHYIQISFLLRIFGGSQRFHTRP